MKSADLSDYWQFSAGAGPNANRSGINETRSDFRALGKMITSYMNNKYPDLVKDIESKLPHGGSGNVFQDLSDYLFSTTTPDKIANPDQLATAVSTFLVKVQSEAQNITAAQVAAQGGKTAAAPIAGGAAASPSGHSAHAAAAGGD